MHNFAQPTEDSGKSQKRHLEIWELTMGLVGVEGLPRLFCFFFVIFVGSLQVVLQASWMACLNDIVEIMEKKTFTNRIGSLNKNRQHSQVLSHGICEDGISSKKPSLRPSHVWQGCVRGGCHGTSIEGGVRATWHTPLGHWCGTYLLIACHVLSEISAVRWLIGPFRAW